MRNILTIFIYPNIFSCFPIIQSEEATFIDHEKNGSACARLAGRWLMKRGPCQEQYMYLGHHHPHYSPDLAVYDF